MTQQAQPTARWGEKDARQADIRNAARTILARDGLEGLSMRQVAKEAGVVPGTVYTYFASKEALFADLYAERLEQMSRDIRERCTAATDTAHVFRVVAELYLDIYRTFGHELNAWSALSGIGHDTGAEDELDETTQRLIVAAVDVFSTALGELERVDPDLAIALQANGQIGVQLLWVTVSGLAEHFASSRHLLHDSSPDRLTEVGIRVLIAGLRAELSA